MSGTGTHIQQFFVCFLLFSPCVYIIWTGFIERIGINQASTGTRGFSGAGKQQVRVSGICRSLGLPLLLLRVSFVSFSFVLVM